MSHAEKCPVCEGAGRLPDGKGETSSARGKDCNGCGGKGWVTVDDGSPSRPCWPPPPQLPIHAEPDQRIVRFDQPSIPAMKYW